MNDNDAFTAAEISETLLNATGVSLAAQALLMLNVAQAPLTDEMISIAVHLAVPGEASQDMRARTIRAIERVLSGVAALRAVVESR